MTSSDLDGFDKDSNADAFAALARRRLERNEPALHSDMLGYPSDFDLNPDAAPLAQQKVTRRPAAVLVPILAHPKPTLLFTQRRDDLPVHSGQISFPGGKLEAHDRTLTETALREANEEVGLTPENVEITGYLEPYHTATGFVIVPVVGLVNPAFKAQPDPREVAEIFQVPLAHFLDPKNHQVQSKMFNNKLRKFYAMPYEERYIWGATAGILRNLYKRISGS